MIGRLLLPVLVLAGAVRSLAAATYVVNSEGTGDFATIQAAVTAAMNGDVLELADGEFKGEGNRDIDFLGKSISVRSQSGTPETCIIDCEGTRLDPHRGFFFQSGEGSASRLEGVSIVSGYAEEGGGLYFGDGTSPTVFRCLVIGNEAERGGGIYRRFAWPNLISTTISGNVAAFGGGIYSRGAGYGPVLDLCIVSGNCADAGADVFLHDGSATFDCCCINFSNIEGTGIWFGGQFIQEDPLFCDAIPCEEGPSNEGVYTLQVASPCLPESSPCGQLVGALGEGCEVPTLTVNSTWGRIKTRFLFGSGTSR